MTTFFGGKLTLLPNGALKKILPQKGALHETTILKTNTPCQCPFDAGDGIHLFALQRLCGRGVTGGYSTINAGIVVLDKTAGETISIVPKNAAHAILRC